MCVLAALQRALERLPRRDLEGRSTSMLKSPQARRGRSRSVLDGDARRACGCAGCVCVQVCKFFRLAHIRAHRTRTPPTVGGQPCGSPASPPVRGRGFGQGMSLSKNLVFTSSTTSASLSRRSSWRTPLGRRSPMSTSQGRERGPAGERAHARRGPADRSQHRQAARAADPQGRGMRDIAGWACELHIQVAR